MSFNPNYIQSTLGEAANIAATTIAERYALETLSKNGVVSIEEVENVFDIAHRLLTEGSDDMIPATLDLPDQDASVDADVASAGGDEDLDVSDLEGIILPDSEGNQYIIQGGILVPYGDDQDEGDDGAGAGDPVVPAEDADVAPTDPIKTDATDDDLEEGTKPAPDANAAPITENTEAGEAGNEGQGENPDTTELTESTIFASSSEFVKNLINAKIK